MNTPKTPRRLWRSIGAVALGFVVVVALSLISDAVFYRLGWFPPAGQPLVDPAMIGLALFYRTIYGILGAYLTARFAPDSPMRHALIGGGIGFVICVAGIIVMWNADPNWYGIALAMTALPGAWFGGWIHRKLSR